MAEGALMLNFWPFKRAEKIETRASASGFTAEIMAAREAYISGASGVGELTAAVQSCVSLWEGAFALGDVSGTDMLNRRTMAMIARSLALRGEYVALIGDRGLIGAADWDLSTRDGEPKAYRLSVSEAGGGRTMTALAAEVVHFRAGADPVQPWTGQAPLRRARLTAGLLQAIESALAEVYDNAPLGSLIVPFPESSETDLEVLGRGFRRRRGRVLLRESVSVTAAGGPAPNTDWRTCNRRCRWRRGRRRAVRSCLHSASCRRCCSITRKVRWSAKHNATLRNGRSSRSQC
jgi:hypothetical protein